MNNKDKKASSFENDSIKADTLLDMYFVRKSIRHSVCFNKSLSTKALDNLKSNDNILLYPDDYNKTMKNKNTLLRKSNSSPLIIIDTQLYYDLIFNFNDSKIRKDMFGIAIKKNINTKHRIKFAPEESLVVTRKVMSYSRITRKLNNEASKPSEGLCLLF